MRRAIDDPCAEFYLASEVDNLIADKDAEIARLKERKSPDIDDALALSPAGKAFVDPGFAKKERMAKKRLGISENEFVEAVRELYPNALFHQLDEKDFDDVWIRGIGYWEADRVLYSRSDRNIRMWRNFGGCDRHFKNLNVFKEWLKNAHANNRKFEETSEAAQ